MLNLRLKLLKLILLSKLMIQQLINLLEVIIKLVILLTYFPFFSLVP